MAQATLQSPSHLNNEPDLPSLEMACQKIQALAVAPNALVTALHHVRANDSNLMRDMANTRHALDEIQDMRRRIK